MTNAKRGRGSRRGIALCAVAALGLALSACGGPGSGGSDPQSDSSLPTASSGGVTINWTPPTQNTNGTSITNLAGYDINYGTSSGDYTQTVSVSNPGIASYVVDNLTPGTYYFSVTAYNSDGAQGLPSPEVSATVN
ncbi:MAG: fibronectin type III domain-containing protein [Steroidobacteraceae bacterium]